MQNQDLKELDAQIAIDEMKLRNCPRDTSKFVNYGAPVWLPALSIMQSISLGQRAAQIQPRSI